MKTFVWIIGLLAAIAAVGCTTEDDNNSSNADGDTDTDGDTDGDADADGDGDGDGDADTDTDTDTDSDSDSDGDCTNITGGANPDRVCIRGKQYYLNGINVAWDQWNGDMLYYNAAKFDDMFTSLQSIKANSIRWWWFIDGSQITYNGNLAQPLAQAVFDNMDIALDAAAENGVLIMPVFLSFDIENANRTFLVTDDAAMDAFIDNVVTPLVQRYNRHPGLGLWEIMNEPEWLLTNEDGSVTMAQMQRFHGKMAAAIHAADETAIVTSGMAMFKYMTDGGNSFSDEALIAAADGDPLAYFDVFQTHYYSWQHGDGWSYEPWIRTSNEWLPEGRPVIIGEFPCKGEEGNWTAMDMHVKSVELGYAGTFCWAFFDNRLDKEGYWEDAKAPMKAIADLIPGAMSGQ